MLHQSEMSLQEFCLLVPHSEKNHQISMARMKQTPKKPTNGKQPSTKSIKTAAAARKKVAVAATGGVKKPH